MNRITKYIFSVVAVMMMLAAVSGVSFAADVDLHTHSFKNSVCEECGAYYVAAGETEKIAIETEKLIVSWTTPEGSGTIVDVKGGFDILGLYHYVNVTGLKEGEAQVYAYSGGELIKKLNVVVKCETHKFSNYVSDGNATCEDGTKTGSCEYCGVKNTVIDEGSAKHQYGIYTYNNDATCDKDGTKTAACTKCGKVNTITAEKTATGHVYGEYVSNNDATCDKDGTKSAKCTTCDKVNTVEDKGSALGHLFNDYISDNNATCTEDGTKTSFCARCDAKDTRPETGSRLGHLYGTWTVLKEANCTEGGHEQNTCQRCGHFEDKETSALGHKFVIQNKVYPTCISDGKTSGSYCSRCGEIFIKQEVIPAYKHTYTYSTDYATPNKNGTYMETCEVCDSIFVVETIYRPKTIKFEKSVLVYNGKVQKNKLIIKDIKGREFVEGTDYTVSYSTGRKEIGKHTAVITFKGKFSGKKTLSFDIVPSKTKKITATQTQDTITLKWNAVKGATGYRVYVYDAKTKSYKALKNVDGKSYTIKKLKAGTTYKYAVKAYTKLGSKVFWANEYTVITTSTKTAAPTVKITAASKKAELSWKKITGATGYQVYVAAPGEAFERVAVTKETSYTVKGLKKGVTYKFRVRAYKKLDGKNIYGDYKTYSVTVK